MQKSRLRERHLQPHEYSRELVRLSNAVSALSASDLLLFAQMMECAVMDVTTMDGAGVDAANPVTRRAISYALQQASDMIIEGALL
jgi:hypothetical protein